MLENPNWWVADQLAIYTAQSRSWTQGNPEQIQSMAGWGTWTWDHKVPSPAPLLPLHFIILLPLFGLLTFCRHCGSCRVYTGLSRVLWPHSCRGLVTFDVSGCWWCQSSCVVSPNSNTRACAQAMEGLIGGCRPPVTGFYWNPCSCHYL